jgi:hypothetical protein
MKNKYLLFLCCIAFAKLSAQEFPKPNLIAPEETFYSYLDNEEVSNPEKYKGKVQKVTITYREYEDGIIPATVEQTKIILKEGKKAKTITRYYSYGIESSKEIVNHFETPEAEIVQEGNSIIKIIKEELPADLEFTVEQKGDDFYVYKNELLTAFYNNNDSISFIYDSQNRLISKRHFISLIAEDFEEDENGTITQWRSAFTERSLEKITYENDLPSQKIIYDKFGEVIDVYKKTYRYSKNKTLKSFQTNYKRYLFDYYTESVPIDQQEYETFPIVEMNDSIQKGTFEYSKTNKITAYIRTKGEEKETYTITYNKNDQMHIVIGTLRFLRRGKPVDLDIEYEYLYDAQGNPSSVKAYYYKGGEKLLQRETTFEIEYF